jgi:hypothetical protein
MEAVRVVPVEVAGRKVKIEVTELSISDDERPVAASLSDMQFADVMHGIEGIASELGGLLKRVGPSKASIEFSIEVGLESGKLTALLVKGSGKANFKVALSWDNIRGAVPSS